jgi:hypothetical protein
LGAPTDSEIIHGEFGLDSIGGLLGAGSAEARQGGMVWITGLLAVGVGVLGRERGRVTVPRPEKSANAVSEKSNHYDAKRCSGG